jgi:hypothetical protein
MGTQPDKFSGPSVDIRGTGMYLAEHVILPEAGFVNIRLTPRSRYADFYAELDGARYAICVEVRKKYTNKGVVNPRYKLDDPKDLYARAERAEVDLDATAAWLAIPIDPDAGVFSAYFGLLSDLHGNTGIPMKDKDVQAYECLARDKSLVEPRKVASPLPPPRRATQRRARTLENKPAVSPQPEGPAWLDALLERITQLEHRVAQLEEEKHRSRQINRAGSGSS